MAGENCKLCTNRDFDRYHFTVDQSYNKDTLGKATSGIRPSLVNLTRVRTIQYENCYSGLKIRRPFKC